MHEWVKCVDNAMEGMVFCGLLGSSANSMTLNSNIGAGGGVARERKKVRETERERSAREVSAVDEF